MITASNYLQRVKTELQIFGSYDDGRVVTLITEALEDLQSFKCKTLVDTVTDATTETTLSQRDIRYLCIYCKMMYDNDQTVAPALTQALEKVRDH